MILRFLSKALSVVVLVLVLISDSQPCPVPVIRDETGNVPKVVDVIAGKDVRLTCRVKENGVNISWLKNNKTLSPSDHPRMRLKFNKHLKIKRVQKDDAGFYTCVAENACGRNFYRMQLLVGSPTRSTQPNSTPAAPKFTVSPDRLSRNLMVFPVGKSVKLDCSAEGHPRPSVIWHKDGERFLERKGGMRLYLSQWTFVLSILDVVPSDTGKYTCNVSNAYGWINHTYYVDVRARARAEPVVLPMRNVTVHEGENASLECKTLSDSMPHFQWLRWHSSPSHSTTNSTIEHPHYEVIKQNLRDPDKHLVLLKSNNKFDFHGAMLTLVNVTKKDEGKYTCIVGNAVGYAVEQAYIIVYRTNADKQEQNVSQKHENSTDGMPTASAYKDGKPGKKSAWTNRQVKKARASSSTAKSRRPEIDSLRAKYEVQNEYVVVSDYNRNV